jgi:hypothetical protein
MYVSRLNFYTVPGKSGEVEQLLKDLRTMVERQGGALPRILRTYFASLGAPDIVFEQEAFDMAALEEQIAKVTESSEFQEKSRENFITNVPYWLLILSLLQPPYGILSQTAPTAHSIPVLEIRV